MNKTKEFLLNDFKESLCYTCAYKSKCNEIVETIYERKVVEDCDIYEKQEHLCSSCINYNLCRNYLYFVVGDEPVKECSEYEK